MSKTEKLLQSCPKCSYQFNASDYIASLAICKQCHTSSPKNITKDNPLYTYRAWIVGVTLLLAAANFGYLTYSHWDTLLKKDSTPTHYIKRYWSEIKEEKLITLLQGCLKKNDLKCQMLAYKKLHELKPKDSFYKKKFEARVIKVEKAKNTKPFRFNDSPF